MMRWYAVYTKPRLEVWAGNNLRQRGFEVYLPQCARRRSHARKIELVRAALFSRYLFLRADLACCARPLINTAPGVVGLVAFGEMPAPVPDAVVAEIRGRENDDGLVPLADSRNLKPNDKLKIVDGALSDVVGLFVQATDDDRVILLLNLLGRQVRARLPISAVQREL